MGFQIAAKTLESLEWPELVERLRGFIATPLALERLDDPRALFAEHRAELDRLQAETREARDLLESSSGPGLEGIKDLASIFARARKGGGVTPRDLRDVAATCEALSRLVRTLGQSEERAPLLAERVFGITAHTALAAEIEGAIGPDGRVRDDASGVLAAARSDIRRFASEAQRKIERSLRDDDLQNVLADSYYTVRNDRYVLPVRADSRGRLPGIVHDASGSGTTLFVEPQALVELNNRHKRAELAAKHEERRILAELSDAVADAADDLRFGISAAAEVDLAFARAKLSAALRAVPPTVGSEGRIDAPGLRHPLLDPDEAVANDLGVGTGYSVLVISGPNAGGKTVAMKAIALAVLMVRAGIQVPALPGARVDMFRAVLADIGDEQNIRESLSTFSAHVANLGEIVASAGPDSLAVLDEIGVGTDPGEGAALAQATLESLADSGARVVTTTHYNLLKEMAEVDPRFENAAVSFDPETLAPTYALRMGSAGVSSAMAVAERMGMAPEVIGRARALLDNADRKLDRMLSELATSRAALEAERKEAQRLRDESESARSSYSKKLEQLENKREKLFGQMRDELQDAFRLAHEEVAEVIRGLQRGGTAQEAARARARLLDLERESGAADAATKESLPESRIEIDWQSVSVGASVKLPGGQEAVLVSLPDRRGKAQVQIGSARLSLPAETLSQASGTPRTQPKRRQPIRVPEAEEAAIGPCDLRGQRVLEAVDNLTGALERARSARAYRLIVIHGFGTGALRRSVREELHASPYVERYEAAEPAEGGEGATIAYLRRA